MQTVILGASQLKVTRSRRTPGSVLGLAERLTSSIQTCWPFITAVARRRTRRPRPGPATGGSGGAMDGATARARARGRRQDWRDAPTHVGPPAGGGAWWRCAGRPGATRWAARYRHSPATRSGPGLRGSP